MDVRLRYFQLQLPGRQANQLPRLVPPGQLIQTIATGIAVGDQIQYRFLYDTGDSCCGPSDIQGWAFDNVLISGFTGDVPEPASLALMSLGLVGFAYRRRNQKKGR